MKKFKLITGSLSIFVALICALAPWVWADDKQAISDLEHKIATITSADEAMKYYADGNDVGLFDMMGRRRISWARSLFTITLRSFRE